MARDGQISRRELLQRAGAFAAAAYVLPGGLGLRGGAAPALAAGGASGGYALKDYLAFADYIQAFVDKSWRRKLGVYGGQKGTTSAQANMLLVHASAAVFGHTGLSRNDAR